MAKEYHVTENSDGTWSVKGENSERASAVCETKGQAIVKAEEFLNNRQDGGSIFVHGRDGRVADVMSVNR